MLSCKYFASPPLDSFPSRYAVTVVAKVYHDVYLLAPFPHLRSIVARTSRIKGKKAINLRKR